MDEWRHRWRVALAFTTRCIRTLASRHAPWPLDRLAPIVEFAEPADTLAQAFDTACQSEYRWRVRLRQHADRGEAVDRLEPFGMSSWASDRR